jgi:hypothetical protein
MTIIENVQNSWNVESVGVLRYWISRISYTPSRNVTVSSVSCWVVGASKRKTTPKCFPLQEAAEAAECACGHTAKHCRNTCITPFEASRGASALQYLATRLTHPHSCSLYL